MRQAKQSAVSIGRRDGRMTSSGIEVCGCRSCPVCGPRIQAGRRDEISEAVTAARAAGYQLRFLTLTIRHQLRDELGNLIDALLSCLKGLVSGRWYQQLRRAHGVLGSLRVIECKHGCEHGWHPHAHILLFFDPAQGPLGPDDGLFEAMIARWFELTAAAGYAAGTAGQAYVDVTEREIDKLASYFTKESADSLTYELASYDTKTRGESLTPAQLLQVGAAGDTASQKLFREFELAIKGRRLIAWSPGLRQLLRQAPMEENLRLAEPAPIPPSECLVRIPRSAFDAIVGHAKLLAELVTIVESGCEPEDVLWWLHDRGVEAYIPEDREPAPLEHDVAAPPGAPAWLALPAGVS